MENLISMTDYVLEQYTLFINENITSEQFRDNVWNYAKFLSMPLELKMFVACDENNIPLKLYEGEKIDQSYPFEFKKSLSEVIFEGFEWYKGISTSFAKKDFDYVYYEFCKNRKIEDIVREFDNLKLTPNAKLKYKF